MVGQRSRQRARLLERARRLGVDVRARSGLVPVTYEVVPERLHILAPAPLERFVVVFVVSQAVAVARATYDFADVGMPVKVIARS